jgi:hypothetical protein
VAARPYPGGMARSKPTDSPAPTGKAGRGPRAGGRGRGSSAATAGATAAKGRGTGEGKAKGEPKTGRLKKFGGQLKLIGQAYTLSRKNDPKLPWILLIAFVVVAAVVEVVGILLGSPFVFIPIAILLALLVTLIVFTRRVQSSQFRQVEGQPGAAAWALETMRGDWRVTSGVAGTPQFDAVHRVLGRPGIVLVGEGSPGRVRGLLAQEKKKVARIVGDTPIYDIVVGDEEGQVPLRKLASHVMKLPRNLSAAEVNSLGRRMSALGGQRMPIPGGPLPGGKQMSVSQRQVRRR